MSRHKALALILNLALLAAGPSGYHSHFTATADGKLPADVQVLDGDFSIRPFDGAPRLELAGDPLGSFGALVGTESLTATDVRGRVWAAARGKRFPEFGVGANDAGGYKLILAPGRGVLELRKGDDTVATAPVEWKSGTWTWFRLRVSPGAEKKWHVEGRVWPDGQDEPAKWQVEVDDPEAPAGGKASVWGETFSEEPIRFDDLSVSAP